MTSVPVRIIVPAVVLLFVSACVSVTPLTDETRPGSADAGDIMPPSTALMSISTTGSGAEASETASAAPSFTSPSKSTEIEALWVPRADSVLPLPWAEFHDMHERQPGLDSDLMETSGTLQIEGKCLYLDEWLTEQHRPSDPLRWVLSLPRDLVQYDDNENALWLHRQLGPVGPFVTGDEIVASDISWSKLRSSACGHHRILRAPSIEQCSNRHRDVCSVASYSSTHGVLPSEAERRLGRIPQMEEILASLRNAEPHRTAGWGIDRADPYMRIGDSFVAWLWLTGDDPPSPQAKALAAEHPDIEFRIGASVTYAQLQSAQQQFGDGNGIYLPRDTLDGAVQAIELSEAVAWTWINHRSNALEIAIDTYRIPYDVGSVMLTGDPNSYDDNRWPPQDELFAAIADDVRARIDVPFDIVFRRIDPDERHR